MMSEARLDDLKGGRLLGHEQDRASPRDHLRDNVCDGLALASARRSVHHKASTINGCLDALPLARVGIEDAHEIFWGHDLIKGFLRNEIEIKVRGGLGAKRESVDEGMA